MSGRFVKLMVAGVVCVGVSGCRHKAAPLVIPAPTPVAVSNPSTNPSELPTESAGKVPLTSVPAVPGEPAKAVRKRPAPAPPVEVAAATPPPPPPIEIGSLTTAGNESAANRKEAADLLTANEKRLAGLSADLKAREKDQVARVQTFQTDGTKALNGGDAEAAITLARKAKVLLDEITK